MACCTPKNLHCVFFCQYPIEIFLSIMWKSVANIWWFPKKSISFLAALLRNSTINFIYVHRFSRSCLVTYLGISIDVKIEANFLVRRYILLFHQYSARNFHLNSFSLLGIIFLSYFLLEITYQYILFKIFHK